MRNSSTEGGIPCINDEPLIFNKEKRENTIFFCIHNPSVENGLLSQEAVVVASLVLTELLFQNYSIDLTDHVHTRIQFQVGIFVVYVIERLLVGVSVFFHQVGNDDGWRSTPPHSTRTSKTFEEKYQ